MGAQDVILGARVLHLRELKTEVARLKAENTRLHDENAALHEHFALALLAAEDLRTLPPDGHFIVMDGWNLILGAHKDAQTPHALIAQAKAHLATHPADRIWIIFDGPKENVQNEDRLRISYTGGTGAHRADRLICDFVRMAWYRGDASRLRVRTYDKDIRKTLSRVTGVAWTEPPSS